jgi:hypothetical protein
MIDSAPCDMCGERAAVQARPDGKRMWYLCDRCANAWDHGERGF